MKRPRCESESVVKHGTGRSGGWRYLCKTCSRHFISQPDPMGYLLARPPRWFWMAGASDALEATCGSILNAVANGFNAVAACVAAAGRCMIRAVWESATTLRARIRATRAIQETMHVFEFRHSLGSRTGAKILYNRLTKRKLRDKGD